MCSNLPAEPRQQPVTVRRYQTMLSNRMIGMAIMRRQDYTVPSVWGPRLSETPRSATVPRMMRV